MGKTFALGGNVGGIAYESCATPEQREHQKHDPKLERCFGGQHEL